MKSDVIFMLKLIASVVSGNNLPKAHEDVNWERIFAISSLHNVENLVAYAVCRKEYQIPENIEALFLKKMYERVAIDHNQSIEIKRIMESFENENISYMPLKGILLKQLYPSTDMRFMSDADILIKSEEYEKIYDLMINSGYEFVCESDHEYNFIKKPFSHIELHKHLIPSYNEDMYEYFGDGWKLAKKISDNSSRYELGIEDNFIFIFAHFAKHYRDTGCGIKPLIDIWLYMKKYSNMDTEYVITQLKELNLNTFYENVSKLLNFWFEDGESDETIWQMTQFIIDSTTFGTKKNQVAATTIREYAGKDLKKAQKEKYLTLLFPPIEKMKINFPFLEKKPVLLPFCWLIRIFTGIIFRRKNIKHQKNRLENITQDNINNYKKHMQIVGLDIYNGRK